MQNKYGNGAIKKEKRGIDYYKHMSECAICPYEKIYWMSKALEENEKHRQVPKEFTIEELSQYDGSFGKPAYVAVNGTVYDVSLNMHWAGGTHFALYAGKNLTDEFKKCHDNNVEILKVLPVVGILKNK